MSVQADIISCSANLSVVLNPDSAPLSVEEYATMECPKPVPRFRSTVESVRSRCHLEMGSLAARCSKRAFATPRLPSEFSKSMGLTCSIPAGEPWQHSAQQTTEDLADTYNVLY